MQVYKITCSVNGKSYIGITKRGADCRFKQHLRDAKRKATGMLLHRAIRHYGSDAFSIAVLRECGTLDDLRASERELIAQHDTMSPNGYNLCAGGEGVFNPSEETTRKKSQSAKSNHADPDVSRRHSDGIRAFNNSLTDEQREARRLKSRAAREANGTLGFPKACLDAAAQAKKTPEWSEKASKTTAAKWQEPGYLESWSKSVRQKKADTKDKYILCVDNGLIFSSARAGNDWVRANGFPKAARNNLCLCCNGRYKTFCGMKWEYVDAAEVRAKGLDVIV